MSTEDAGFRAAELLAKAMSRRRLPRGTEEILYTGTHVVARRSTARTFMTDSLVRRCCELVEANVGRRFTVKDLVATLRVSRRTLELRTRRTLGRSLGMEIAALRLSRAAVLLLDTDLPVAEIAERAGFCDASYFVLRFKRHYGVTPAAWRRRPVPRA